MKLRIMNTGFAGAHFNMALDEAIARGVAAKTSPPTLRFYGWDRPAVSIGSGQSICDLNLAKAGELGWDYVRRISGGGAVFHQNDVTYSFIVAADFFEGSPGIIDSHKIISKGIIAGLSNLGIESGFNLNSINTGHEESAAKREFNCFTAHVNFDITVNGKKIAGSAQSRKFDTILQHGTILIDYDPVVQLFLMNFILEEDRLSFLNKIEDSVTCLSKVLRRRILFNEAYPALRPGFIKELNLDVYEGEITLYERKLTEELISTKYTTEKWNKKL